MRWHTHVAFGFLAGLIAMKFISTGNIYIFFAFVLLGALAPDIDQPDSKMGRNLGIVSKLIKAVFGHRGVIHTVWGALLICGAVWLFWSHPYGNAMFTGFASHLFSDGLTKQGIKFLHPVSKARISGFIRTGGVTELVFFIATLFLIGLIIF